MELTTIATATGAFISWVIKIFPFFGKFSKRYEQPQLVLVFKSKRALDSYLGVSPRTVFDSVDPHLVVHSVVFRKVTWTYELTIRNISEATAYDVQFKLPDSQVWGITPVPDRVKPLREFGEQTHEVVIEDVYERDDWNPVDRINQPFASIQKSFLQYKNKSKKTFHTVCDWQKTSPEERYIFNN